MTNYTLEKWVEYHGSNVPIENHQAEFEKWLDWRLSVDYGETIGLAPSIISEERNYKPYLGKNGRLIDGKKQHREYLKENGFIEISGEQKHLDKIKSDKKVASKKARRKRIEEYLAGKPLHESQRTA